MNAPGHHRLPERGKLPKATGPQRLQQSAEPMVGGVGRLVRDETGLRLEDSGQSSNSNPAALADKTSFRIRSPSRATALIRAPSSWSAVRSLP